MSENWHYYIQLSVHFFEDFIPILLEANMAAMLLTTGLYMRPLNHIIQYPCSKPFTEMMRSLDYSIKISRGRVFMLILV